MNLLKSLNNYSKKIYNYFFTYNINKLTTFAQEHALFHKEYILLTYQNGKTEIGQLIKRTSAGRFVLDSYDNNIIRIIDLNDIFNVETA